jgi:hypothetical protein
MFIFAFIELTGSKIEYFRSCYNLIPWSGFFKRLYLLFLLQISEMDTESPTPEKPAAEAVKPPKRRGIFIAASIAVLLFVAIIFFFNRNSATNVPAPEKKKEPAFHRDEPTEKQIFQVDYKQKVREMLDSGKSAMEISKETKIRIDEVRRIKKEYKQEKAGK